MGRWRSGGYTFDTGPTVLTMPALIDEALSCVGESSADWLDLIRVEPAYRGQFSDGSVLNSYSDADQMADEVARVCGSDEAFGYRRLAAYLTELYRVEFGSFMDRNLDSAGDVFCPDALTLLRLGGLRSLDRVVGRFLTDDRLRRLFTFQSLYAGLAPSRARALYAVISYLDSVSGVWYPRGGMYQVAHALAGAATKHGVEFSYSTRATKIEVSTGRARAVITDRGERIPADVVIASGDLAATYRELLPAELSPPGLRPAGVRPAGPRPGHRRRYSPSAVVWHIGSSAAMPVPAHHTISFGTAWKRTFREIISEGRLMSDPTVLITNPSFSDPDVAPPGGHVYYVLAPCPNTDSAAIDWPNIGPRYVDELAQVLANRGFDVDGAFSGGVEIQRHDTPRDWAARGLSAGTPFALAHTLSQTGPFRHPTQHPAVNNLLFCGAGVQPGVGLPTALISGRLAAARVLGSSCS
jgi:phytoene desaturase